MTWVTSMRRSEWWGINHLATLTKVAPLASPLIAHTVSDAQKAKLNVESMLGCDDGGTAVCTRMLASGLLCDDNHLPDNVLHQTTLTVAVFVVCRPKMQTAGYGIRVVHYAAMPISQRLAVGINPLWTTRMHISPKRPWKWSKIMGECMRCH
ncbi:hypothetical protein EJ06DRAFT_234397 [Trichodelitschia bisporula]|uniref:Uncharacterized protein n=1 Tax=Trichodelitschia bisporula TaxID=703511 RepID=A0A6G1HKE0_9PEZI|nr:hypothetical protein EJ06DRAFT_234397 [Trichodelitschia bisporula]